MLLLKKKKLTDLMHGLRDIHCHLLPGVDDGVPDAAKAVRLLKRMEAMGVRELYMTPHIINGVYGSHDEEFLRREFKGFVNDTGVGIRLAAEYFLDDRFLDHVGTKPLTFAGNHILVESSLNSYAVNAFEMLFEANVMGCEIIIAHPERYTFIQNDRDDKILSALLNSRYKLQLNLLSVTGYHGKRVRSTALRFLAEGLYTFVGTDTHSDRHLNHIETATVSARTYSRLEKLKENNASLF